MKKFYSRALMALAAMTALPTLPAAADQLTVNDGTGTNEYSPIYAYYFDVDNRSQLIYDASALTELQGKTITSLTFYYKNTSKALSNTVQMYLGPNENAYFTESAWLPNTGLTQVFNGEMSFPKTTDPGEITVNFTTPFLYTGGNLLVEFDYAAKGGNYGRIYWYGKDYEGPASQSPSLYSRSLNGAVTFGNFSPKTTFTYETGAQGAAATVSAAFISFNPQIVGDAPVTSTVTVANTGSEALQGTASVDNSIFSVTPATLSIPVGGTQTLTVSFNPAAAEEYTGNLTVALNGGISLNVELSGNGYIVPEGNRVTFNGTNYQTTLPEGWSPYMQESGATGSFSTDYSEFLSYGRFESATRIEIPGIFWNHTNPMAAGETMTRSYYLVSPAVQGDVWVNALTTESDAAAPYFKAYVATPNADGSFTLSDEISINWDGSVNSQNWTAGTFTVPAGSRVAYMMKYAGMSMQVDKPSISDGVQNVFDSDLSGDYTVVDLSGKVVARGNGNVQDAQRGLNPGMYIVRIGGKASKVIVR